MTSRPGSLGNPRSTIATSSGYSRPAKTPSSPSCATSTVKPASVRRDFRVSRSTTSSSTTSTLMPAPPPVALYKPLTGLLQDSAILGIDAHSPHVPGVIQELEDIDRLDALVLRFGTHDTGFEALFGHLDRLVHRHTGRIGHDGP